MIFAGAGPARDVGDFPANTDPSVAQPDKRMLVPMSEFLRSAGYVVLGQEREYISDNYRMSHGEIYEHWLVRHSQRSANQSGALLIRRCHLGRHQLDSEVEVLTRMDMYYKFVAADVPRYFAIHSGENHNRGGGILHGLELDFDRVSRI